LLLEKWGSRKGNVITGESLLNDVRDEILEKMTDRNFSNVEQEKIATNVSVSAIKYSILKQSTGGDIIFDFKSSILLKGTLVRICNTLTPARIQF